MAQRTWNKQENQWFRSCSLEDSWCCFKQWINSSHLVFQVSQSSQQASRSQNCYFPPLVSYSFLALHNPPLLGQHRLLYLLLSNVSAGSAAKHFSTSVSNKAKISSVKMLRPNIIHQCCCRKTPNLITAENCYMRI